MQLTSTPKIIRADEGHCLELGGEAHRQILRAHDTAGVLSLSQSRFRSRQGVPLHAHKNEDTWFWIERGAFDFEIGADCFPLLAGDFIFVPAGTVHSYTSTGRQNGALLIGAMGAQRDQFFRELARQIEERLHLNRAQMRRLGAKYGVLFEDFESLEVPLCSPLIVRSNEGERVEAFGDTSRFLIASSHVQGRFCLSESKTPPLSGPPLHVHDREDEAFFILLGRYEFQLGEARFQVGAGDVVWAPRAVPHTFRIVSPEPGRCLTLRTPGGFDEFLTKCMQLFQREKVTPTAIAQIGQEHQLRFLSRGV